MSELKMPWYLVGQETYIKASIAFNENLMKKEGYEIVEATHLRVIGKKLINGKCQYWTSDIVFPQHTYHTTLTDARSSSPKKLHREDGPAFAYNNAGANYKAWYLNGTKIKAECGPFDKKADKKYRKVFNKFLAEYTKANAM